MRILVTGGAGFIGSALVRHLVDNTNYEVLNVDKLTYAGNLDSIKSVSSHASYQFKQVDICNRGDLFDVFNLYKPDAVMHLAAETHVDRSIENAAEFLQTNIMGTYNVLEACRAYPVKLLHHISTDEVYGDLEEADPAFKETTPYSPSSPYSASKAGSDHLVRAWHRTYGIPVIITNTSNNYGPFQFPEKLIPHMILSALNGKALPIYGDGKQVRDWLFVDDHVEALVRVLESGEIGNTYNIGGNSELRNIDVVEIICEVLEEFRPGNYKSLITYVEDRPGHDRRYAIDNSKINSTLGWSPKESFKTGIRKTIAWYLENDDWCKRVLTGEYSLNRKGLV